MRWCVVFLLAAGFVLPSQAREKEVLAYGEGLIVNVPLLPAVASVNTGDELDKIIGFAFENVLLFENALA